MSRVVIRGSFFILLRNAGVFVHHRGLTLTGFSYMDRFSTGNEFLTGNRPESQILPEIGLDGVFNRKSDLTPSRIGVD